MEKFILNRDDTAIMMVDIQERLVPAMNGKERVIHNAKILIQCANKMDIPIIYTEQYPKGLGHTIEELSQLLEDEKRVEKIHFSALTQEVKNELEKMNRKKIIIIGMETHVCVFQTVRELLAYGYGVFVVNDAVASRTEENYQNGLNIMETMGAVITNTEMVVFDLLKKAGTVEFKFMSKLIK